MPMADIDNRREIIGGLLFCLAQGFGGAAIAQSSLPDGGRWGAPTSQPVAIHQLLELPSNSTARYKVSYSYDFPSHSTVYIPGIGTVSPKGQLTYWSSETELEFLDRSGGTRIAAVPLSNPSKSMGGSVTRFPDESQFPPVSRQARLKRGILPSDRATMVLGHFFPLGYFPYEKSKVPHFLTTYQYVPLLQSKRTFAQIAVLLTYATEADSRDTLFLVRYQARERRSHTDWYDEYGTETADAVQSFLNGVLKSLETGDRP